MVRSFVLALGLGAAGCHPIVYVPSPVPSSAGGPGVRLGAEGNAPFGQRAARLDASPSEAVTVVGRVGVASGGRGSAPLYPYRLAGGDLGLVVQRPVAPDVLADLGVVVGRDRIRARGEVPAHDGEPVVDDIEVETWRVGVHVGAFAVARLGAEERFRVGPALRVTHLDVGARRRQRAGPEVGGGRAVLVEPVVRGRLGGGWWEAEVQAGVSVPIDGDLRGRLDIVPVLLSARLGVRVL